MSSDQHNPPRFIAKLNYTDAIDFAYPQKNNHNLRYSFTKLCNIYCAYQMAGKICMETDKKICVNAFNGVTGKKKRNPPDCHTTKQMR